MNEDESRQETQTTGDEGAREATEVPRPSGGGLLFWLKPIFVAVVAAVIGAAVSANWHEQSFSLVIATKDINAGLVILAAVAGGFVLGMLFLWSVISGQESNSQ